MIRSRLDSLGDRIFKSECACTLLKCSNTAGLTSLSLVMRCHVLIQSFARCAIGLKIMMLCILATYSQIDCLRKDARRQVSGPVLWHSRLPVFSVTIAICAVVIHEKQPKFLTGTGQAHWAQAAKLSRTLEIMAEPTGCWFRSKAKSGTLCLQLRQSNS